MRAHPMDGIASGIMATCYESDDGLPSLRNMV